MSTAAIVPKTSPLILEMADRWKISPATMIDTLKATIFPQKDKNGNAVVVSNAQLVAFLQVAHEFNLNPMVKELYAFPTKGGGIVPMVPVDGWLKIINRRPEMDGLTFKDEWDGAQLVSITCTIYRKDRSHPTEVTEYMNECKRDTEPWNKWPARMLRHKSAVQCARIAFSLSGIFDQDEAERILEAEDARPEILRPTPIATAEDVTEVQLKPALELESLSHVEPQGVDVAFEKPIVSDGEKPQPPGPYIEKFQKLFVIAAGAGIKVVKGSHDDELHRFLKQKYGIDSVKQIPVSMWDRVIEDVGKSLAVKNA